MNAVAKPVVKNKYWIVEEGGNKVATIQAIEEGGYSYVHDAVREKFPSIKLISEKYNITFLKVDKKSKDKSSSVYGYPCSTKSFNEVYDVARKLPIYTKTQNSKSFFCAGHYLIKYNQSWVYEFCPKLITVNRYEFKGPYKSKEEAQNG